MRWQQQKFICFYLLNQSKSKVRVKDALSGQSVYVFSQHSSPNIIVLYCIPYCVVKYVFIMCYAVIM